MLDKKYIVWWVMTLLCCITIFCFTSSPNFTSRGTKQEAVKVAKALVEAETKDSLKTADNVKVAEKKKKTEVAKVSRHINYITRKMAHLSLFGFLAVFAERAIQDNELSFVYAWMLSSAYGATDEFHQMFVPNRTPLLFDVAIDSTGALLALVVLFLWLHFTNKEYSLR